MPGERLEQDRQIIAAQRYRGRLRRFLRRYLQNDSEAEDLIQDVYYELVVAARALHPIDEVGAWLLRVARNRMIDLFRRRTLRARFLDEETVGLKELVPAADGGPEAEYASSVLLDELLVALEELPEDQRLAFVAHELDGESFEAMAARTGTAVNTLLARKHRAVKALRARLQVVHEFMSEGGGAS